MTTVLDKSLKRELTIDGQAYTVTLSPEGLTLTLKGRRKGVQLEWRALVSGEAALAAGLNASLGQLTDDAHRQTAGVPLAPAAPSPSPARARRRQR